jgi:hypothetical protein
MMSGAGYAPEGELLLARLPNPLGLRRVYRVVRRVVRRDRPDFPGNGFHQDLFRGSHAEPAFHKIDTPMTPARIEAV